VIRRTRRAALKAALIAAAPMALPLVAARGAHADTGRAFRMICGFPAGGGIDLAARAVSEGLRRQRGWNVTVENRTGASGRIAINALRTAAGDPPALLMSPIEILTLLPHVYRNVGYDPFTDVVPLASVAATPYVVAVDAKSPHRRLEDLLAWCRANPSQASFGTPGQGTPQHLLGEALGKESGVPLTHVAYKGGPAAMQDVLGGRIPFLIVTQGAASQQVAGGQLRLLAHSSAAPSTALADVPTFVQAGFPGLVAESAFVVFANPMLPAPVQQEVATAVDAFARSEAFVPEAKKLGMSPMPLARADVASLMRKNFDFWKRAVELAQFKPLDA
jgi:tripartite-type tricarboxylate transporter receptor subunit TctC